MSWSFSLPVRIEFGAGKVFGELGRLIEGEDPSNGLLTSDPVFIKNGLADQMVEASKGRTTGVFSDLVPNSTVGNVDTCFGLVREQGYEFLTCLGGGGSLGYGKAVRSLCRTQGSIWKYMYGKKAFEPGHLPLITTPTAAGTSNEVTMMAMISDEKNSEKMPVRTSNFYPDLAILDPRLILSLPPSVVASYGIDVLSQALEGCWGRNRQPVCDACAVRACSLIFEYLGRTYRDENDFEARTAMCEINLLAGITFAASRIGGPHMCSYPLTSIYHVPHGKACGITLDSFPRLSKDAQDDRLHQLARMIGRQDTCELADNILALKQRAELHYRLSKAGISESNILSLVRECHHPNMALNPVEVTDEILDAMFHELL